MATGLTPGAGTVTIDGNVIQGNLSGAGHGGGIRVDGFNGQDVASSPGNTNNWHALYLFNNIIVNNVAGYGGGGISLQDLARGVFIHNTVANNDSCATAQEAFPAAGGNSIPQGAGLVGNAHSALLTAAFSAAARQRFSSPVLYDNIFWHNQSFYVNASLNGGAGGLVPNPVLPFWDLQVSGAVGLLNPRSCILTSTTGYHSSNIRSNPVFVVEYTNVNIIAAVPDEAGNAVSLRFSPIYETGNYHVRSNSPAINRAESSFLSTYARLHGDFDTDYRPYGTNSDIGADEYSVATVFSTNDSYFVRQNQILTNPAPGVLINDRGPGALTAAIETAPTNGTLTLSSNGQIIYRPATNFYGTDSFTYRAISGTARSRPTMVTITVSPIVSSPVANADSYTVIGNGSLTVPPRGVLSNDTDPNNFPLSAVLTVAPASGVLALHSDGSFTYTPSNGFTGAITFRYRASNWSLTSGQATVTLNVAAPAPDFIVTGIQLDPAEVTTGSTFTASVKVQNHGTAAGNAGRLSVWADRPGVDVVPGTVGDAFIDLGSLNAGESTTTVFTAMSPPSIAPPGAAQMTASFRAFANSTGLHPDFTQTNNQMTLMYVVTTNPPPADYYPPDTDGIDTDGDGNVSNDYSYVHLAAGDGFIKMADKRDMYVFGFSDASGLTEAETMMRNMVYAGTPAPTLVFREGQRVYLKLTNVGMMMRPDLFDPHTVHFHGFPNAAPIFDGEPMASVAVNMGDTFTYYYELVEPGTYMYHCHVEAPEHMQMGMLGMLWVQPKQNMLPNGANLSGFTHHTGYK
ncbi:MAG: Ig-like domain-containing protein, partial [bacterium]